MNVAFIRHALTLTLAVSLVAGVQATRGQQATPSNLMLGEALHLEEVESNFAGAIEIYRKISSDGKAPRSVVARALLQLGICYERLGQPEARTVYERIVKEHSDSGAVATAARTRLAAMQTKGQPGANDRLITNDRTLGGLGGLRFSPDGRWAMGSRLTPSEFDGSDLYLRNLETASGRSVYFRTPGFGAGFSTFSPDSRKFAALMSQMVPESEIAREIRGEIAPGSLAARGVLVVGSVEADQPQIVVDIPLMPATNTFEPFTNPVAWSPDGKSLAFVMPVAPLRTYDVHVMNTSTGEHRSLGYRASGALDLKWSPSGRELLVHLATSATAPGDLRIIGVAAGEMRSLTAPGTSGARLRVVRWNANGDIAIRHLNPATPQVEDTYLVSSTTGQSRRTCSGQAFNLAGPGGSSTATADICREITLDSGRQIVWRHASKQLVVRDLANGTERPLTMSPGEEYFGTLSPDDKVEVFVSNREGRWGLYSVEIDRAPVQRPTRLAAFDDMPIFELRAWTSRGFIGNVIYNESNILRVNVDSTTGKAAGTERLTQDGLINHTPAISPDGQKIAYWSRRGSRFGVAVMDSNGANERLLVETAQYFPGLQPSWRSPSEVLFMAPPSDTSSGVFVPHPPEKPLKLLTVNSGTGAVSPVGELTGLPSTQGMPRYVPASSEIVHLDPDYKTLRARSLVNGSTRVIANFPGDAEVNSFLPTPDGRSIAFALAQRYANGRACFSKAPTPVATVNQMLVPCEIGLLNVSTGERTVLTTMAGQNAAVPALHGWSPDGRFLLFGGGRPQIFDRTTATRWPLLEPAVPLDWDRTASWSPDGTFIVLTNRSQRFEWREWSGVR